MKHCPGGDRSRARPCGAGGAAVDHLQPDFFNDFLNIIIIVVAVVYFRQRKCPSHAKPIKNKCKLN